MRRAKDQRLDSGKTDISELDQEGKSSKETEDEMLEDKRNKEDRGGENSKKKKMVPRVRYHRAIM